MNGIHEVRGSIPLSSTFDSVVSSVMPFYVYILASEQDGSLYTGQTKDLAARLKMHNKGLVKATKPRTPYRLGYYEVYQTRAEAMWREWQFKTKWNTERKKKLLMNFDSAKASEFP